MDYIFKDLNDIIIEVYNDDIIVKSQHKEDHLMHLQQVFDRLNKFNMKLNAKKCISGITCVKFLRYMISTRGIKVDPTKSEA